VTDAAKCTPNSNSDSPSSLVIIGGTVGGCLFFIFILWSYIRHQKREQIRQKGKEVSSRIWSVYQQISKPPDQVTASPQFPLSTPPSCVQIQPPFMPQLSSSSSAHNQGLNQSQSSISFLRSASESRPPTLERDVMQTISLERSGMLRSGSSSPSYLPRSQTPGSLRLPEPPADAEFSESGYGTSLKSENAHLDASTMQQKPLNYNTPVSPSRSNTFMPARQPRRLPTVLSTSSADIGPASPSSAFFGSVARYSQRVSALNPNVEERVAQRAASPLVSPPSSPKQNNVDLGSLYLSATQRSPNPSFLMPAMSPDRSGMLRSGSSSPSYLPRSQTPGSLRLPEPPA
jgi:hypothetical protein